MTRWTLFGNMVALALSVASMAGAVDVSGRVVVSDGDSFQLRGQSIRLHGIDAPEIGQVCHDANGAPWPCGRWAQAQLQEIVAGRSLDCTLRDIDRYGRQVATCKIGTQDIGALMVARGAAVAFTRYSHSYVALEASARKAGLGLWAGGFERPEDWRRSSRQAEVQRPADAGNCVIKGNISGERRIYHLPGQRHYAETQITPSKGERWFCSEAEARAAGWRKARN